MSYFDGAVHDVFRRSHIGHRGFTDGLSEKHFGIQRTLVELDCLPTISLKFDVPMDFQHHFSPMNEVQTAVLLSELKTQFWNSEPRTACDSPRCPKLLTH